MTEDSFLQKMVTLDINILGKLNVTSKFHIIDDMWCYISDWCLYIFFLKSKELVVREQALRKAQGYDIKIINSASNSDSALWT